MYEYIAQLFGILGLVIMVEHIFNATAMLFINTHLKWCDMPFSQVKDDVKTIEYNLLDLHRFNFNYIDSTYI